MSSFIWLMKVVHARESFVHRRKIYCFYHPKEKAGTL